MDLSASSSESRTVCQGSVSAVGAPRPPVQRERRERVGRRGPPLNPAHWYLRLWKLLSKNSGPGPACPAWGLPSSGPGNPHSAGDPCHLCVQAWRGGRSLWPLPPGRLSSGSPEPARWCGLLRVGPSPAFDSELPEQERRQVLRPQSDPLLQKPDAGSSALE